MTYKSFTTTNELFDHLVARFWTQPPENLAPAELDEWKRLKQHVVRARVLNTFKSMIVDNDILEEEDSFIFERMKEFISNEDVQGFAAAKQLGIHIERAVSFIFLGAWKLPKLSISIATGRCQIDNLHPT